MHRLLVLVFSITTVNSGLVRVPKIYNALISSDENLSPSHTYPVVEPVLRTTALGVAFPPLVPHIPNIKEIPQTDDSNSKVENLEPTQKPDQNVNQPKKQDKVYPQLSYHGTLYPLAFDPYLPYAYSNDFLFPALPYYEQPVYVDLNHFNKKEKIKEKEEINPAVNFKKNPEIPDVPPPPLPIIKDDKKDKQ